MAIKPFEKMTRRELDLLLIQTLHSVGQCLVDLTEELKKHNLRGLR